MQVLSEWADVRRLAVVADHHQFYLQDLRAYTQWVRSHGTDPDVAPAGWTSQAVDAHRIAVEPHSVAIGTAWDDMVEARLCVHAAEPETGMKDAEHVVEADIDVPNGDMVIYGIGDDPDRA